MHQSSECKNIISIVLYVGGHAVFFKYYDGQKYKKCFNKNVLSSI